MLTSNEDGCSGSQEVGTEGTEQERERVMQNVFFPFSRAQATRKKIAFSEGPGGGRGLTRDNRTYELIPKIGNYSMTKFSYWLVGVSGRLLDRLAPLTSWTDAFRQRGDT